MSQVRTYTPGQYLPEILRARARTAVMGLSRSRTVHAIQRETDPYMREALLDHLEFISVRPWMEFGGQS